ncbi:hypothetical protein DD592_27450, partial [Enterobacter cloacae complex sp. 2DZ2F20B]
SHNILRLNRSRHGNNYYGIKFFNVLPYRIKLLDAIILVHKLKEYCISKSFYSTEEFLNNNFDDFI